MPAVEKSPLALKTIREVADELALEPYVLRFWEKEFKQIKPMQRGNGRRYYRREDVDTLRRIKSLLHEQGYTIKGARAVLRGKVQPEAEANGAEVAAAAVPEQKNALHGKLKELHQQLLHMREQISAAL